MDRKDRVIDERLTRYAESVKPKQGVLDAAVYAIRLRQQAAQNGFYIPRPADARSAGVPVRRNRTPWIFSSVAAVVVAAFIIGIAIGIINGGDKLNNNQPSQPAVITPYALNTLNASAGSLADAQNAGVLTLKKAGLSTQGKVYKNGKGETAVVSVFYKTVGGGGIDEILVIADIGRGLTDYKEFKTLQGRTIAGVTVYQREEILNGEYYTNLYFAHGDIDYYLIIASPLARAAEVYVSGLVN